MSEAAALPPNVSNSSNSSNDNGDDDPVDDDDEIAIVDNPQTIAGDNFRLFPERVYEMVSKEAAVPDGVVQWEVEHDGGQAFAIEKASPAFEEILQRYFGRK